MIDVRMRERFREVLDADFKVRCRSGRIIGEIGICGVPLGINF